MRKNKNELAITLLSILFILILACDGDTKQNQYTDIIPDSLDRKDDTQGITIGKTDDKTIQDLLESHSMPIITRKDNIRVRTHPSFLADVVSMMDSGTRITITKRTRGTETSLSGESHYWFYVKTYNDEENKHRQYKSGWVFGGDIEDEDYDLPFINNLPIVNRYEEAEALIVADTLYKYFIIEQDGIIMRYAPNLFASPVYTLNSGDRVNIMEKSAFKQYGLNDDKPMRWMYAVYKKGNRHIGGWLAEDQLPDTITDDLIRQLPANNVYRPVSEKPVYAGEAIIDTYEADKTIARLTLFAGIFSDGVFGDVYYSDGYQDNRLDGKRLWLEENISNTSFYLYWNGDYIGMSQPMDDYIDKAEEWGLLGEDKPIIMVELDKDADVPSDASIMAFSNRIDDGKFPIDTYPHQVSDEQVQTAREDLRTRLRNAFYDEFGVVIDNDAYYQSFNTDLNPIRFNGGIRFFYVSDVRLISHEGDEDSFVFRQSGMLDADGGLNALDSLVKRVNSREEANFILAYDRIVGIIDLDSQDGKEEAVIRLAEMGGDSVYRLVSPSDDGLIIVFE
jgi:hypothetical protein